jgi:hypothetical protein
VYYVVNRWGKLKPLDAETPNGTTVPGPDEEYTAVAEIICRGKPKWLD